MSYTKNTHDCFGSTLIYGTAVCEGCELKERCGSRSKLRLELIQELFNGGERGSPPVSQSQSRLPPSSRPPNKRELTVDEMGLCENLPKKVGDRLARWFRLDIDFQAMTRGENVFLDSGQKFMELIAQELIDNAWVNNSELVKLLMKELDWAYGTASSHVGQAKTALKALDVIHLNRNGSAFSLRRAT